MKTARAALLLVLAALSLALPSRAGTPVAVAGVTEVRIAKGLHRLELVSGSEVVKTYRVAIGPGGPGPKQMEGDKVTPVGTYRIVGRINGLYHQFLTLSYPNDEDRKRHAELKRRGLVPPGRGVGNGIGIHGTGHADWSGIHKEIDWTLGCIALDDAEIDEVAASVKDGTRVVITD
jgi:murein L,D-transpeptidase YafK